MDVDNLIDEVDNGICKEINKKFCTYQRYIILIFLFLN